MTRQAVEGQRLLNVSQAARYLGKTEAAIRSMKQRGELDSCLVELGGSIMFDVGKLDQWIESKSKAKTG